MASAINDAPTDDLDIEDEVFSADRMRAYETQPAGPWPAHVPHLRAAPRHRGAGRPLGRARRRGAPHLADQHDTSVVRSHRGHRLGLLLKTDMNLLAA